MGPRGCVPGQKPRFPEGEKNVAEGGGSAKRLVQIFLTKRLFQFGTDTRFHGVKLGLEVPLGCLAEGLPDSGRFDGDRVREGSCRSEGKMPMGLVQEGRLGQGRWCGGKRADGRGGRSQAEEGGAGHEGGGPVEIMGQGPASDKEGGDTQGRCSF